MHALQMYSNLITEINLAIDKYEIEFSPIQGLTRNNLAL